ncbi:MAG: pyridoxamine 5'-phosphate oxidase family protein [Cytophagales bacterium]|nr:pyridoxamine 5'-phosphate oxidase family protein [Cytophagales bacterium]
MRTHLSESFKSSLHVSIASVNSDNHPNVTPIGSFFLNDNQQGFYFEKFPTHLPTDAKENPNICLLAINSSRWFWLRSLFKGKFEQFPAIKLYGTLGEKRTATDIEIYRLERRMRMTKGLKGHKYLWQDMKHVREVHFTRAQKINLAAMTNHLT